MNKYIDANRKIWDDRVAIHSKSDFYDLKSFKEGKSSLNFIELNELGDIKGKSVLHLQCHFGMDTLSLARLGASVTGVDFSSEAINLAAQLNNELNLNAEFICSDVYNLGDHLQKKFDIVFTSYGVIGWLPDLEKWAELISYYLNPDGTFLIVEFHPVLWMLDDNFEQLKYSYFNNEIIETEVKGTYADRDADISGIEYGWNHSLSEIISSLLKNGLEVISFNEFPFSVYNCFAKMIQGEDGFWRFKNLENKLPLMFSLKCRKNNQV